MIIGANMQQYFWIDQWKMMVTLAMTSFILIIKCWHRVVSKYIYISCKFKRIFSLKTSTYIITIWGKEKLEIQYELV